MNEPQSVPADLSLAAGPSAFWCLDPSTNRLESVKVLLEAIQQWTQADPMPVIPVSVLPARGVPSRETIDARENGFGPLELKEVQDFLRLAETPSVRKIFVARTSHRRAAQKIAGAAALSGAAAIFVNTHGRTGIPRLRKGSFLDELLSVASTPVVTVNPRTRVTDAVRKILVATDFSSSSQQAFQWAVRRARFLKASLILAHVNQLPMEASGALGVPPMAGALWESYRRETQAKADAWVAEAAAAGVSCEFRFLQNMGGVGSSLCEVSKEIQADLIVLGLSRSSATQSFFGWIGRHILARAPRPVVVLSYR